MAVLAEPLRRRDALATVAVLGLLACGLALGGWAWRLDQLLYDLALSLQRRPVPDNVVIVAIDDRSINAIGRWPWPRAVHATLLERLATARPRAVALDFLLSEPDADPRQDTLLARALQHAAPVVLPLTWQAGVGGPPQPLLPAPPLRGAAQLGVAEAAVDADGVLRNAFLHAGPGGGARWPHIALALLQAGGGQPGAGLHAASEPLAEPAARSAVRSAAVLAAGSGAGSGAGSAAQSDGLTRPPDGRRLPAGTATATVTATSPSTSTSTSTDIGPSSRWQRDGMFLIGFAGPPGHIPRVSYVDVLAGRIAPERLAGRYVLVGMTAQGLGDTLATPVNGRHQAMPGVEALANTLLTLERGDAVRALSPGWLATGSTLLLALLVAAMGRAGPRAALPLALGSVPLALAAALLLLNAGWWCSPVPYAAGALLAYPLWSWRRLEYAMAGIDRAISRLAAEPALALRHHGTRSDPIAARLATLHHAGTALREAHAFLADALAAMPTAMLVADGRAQVLLANPPAAALFDVDVPAEMAGLDLARLLAEFSTDQAIDWPAWLAALTPGAPASAVELQQPGREWLLHAAAAEEPQDARQDRATDGQARRPSAQGAAQQAGQQAGQQAEQPAQQTEQQTTDQTAQQTEQQTAIDAGPTPSQRRLIVAIADIGAVRAAQREREQTLAFVSHDLRSPAHSIVLLAELNLGGALATPREALLHEVRRLAARTLALSDDFVRASQARTVPLQPVPLALPGLLADAVADLLPQAQAGGLTLQVHGADTTVQGLDRALLTRAVANLVSNAVRASPPGGRIGVHACIDGADLVIAVQDQGPGLDADQLAQLALGDRGAPVRSAQGVGLGLLFVQRVATRHGGRLIAAGASASASTGNGTSTNTSADGGASGARFELRIPTASTTRSGNP